MREEDEMLLFLLYGNSDPVAWTAKEVPKRMIYLG